MILPVETAELSYSAADHLINARRKSKHVIVPVSVNNGYP